MALYRTDTNKNLKKIAGNYISDKKKANRSADNLSEADVINWKNKLKLDNKANIDASNLSEANVQSWRTKLGQIKELWTNPNPVAEMAAQNIVFNSDDYDYLIAIARGHMNDPVDHTLIIKKGDNGVFKLSQIDWYGTQSDSIGFYSRNFFRVSDTEYALGDCYANFWRDSLLGTVVRNSSYILITVLGVKL